MLSHLEHRSGCSRKNVQLLNSHFPNLWDVGRLACMTGPLANFWFQLTSASACFLKFVTPSVAVHNPDAAPQIPLLYMEKL